MTILYRTAKVISAKISEMCVWGQTAKFNSRQISDYIRYKLDCLLHVDHFSIKLPNLLLSQTSCRCFTLVLFAQLALASPNLLPSQFITVVLNHMNSFLSKTQPEVIKTYEQEHEYIWATLLPYVKLFYLPNECSKKEAGSYNQQMQELRQTSERVILFFLHSKMSQEYCHEILANEGLVDYVTLMPWHVSSGSRSLAEGVISELSCHMKLQPPRLCSIVQAKLARMHFGLECVVASDSPVELIRSVH